MSPNLPAFLLELGTEELPPNQIDALIAALATNLETGLKAQALTYGAVQTFATPRRLAVLIADLAPHQPTQTLELRGPAVKIAFDPAGHPTIAALKFAQNCGVEVSQLQRLADKKGEILSYHMVKPGQNTSELLPEIIQRAVKNLPIKRAMYWGEHCGPFIRPLHWLVALFDDYIIPVEIFGIKATNKTYGHRFHHPQALTITKPQVYEKLLAETGWVIAASDKRKQNIRNQVTALTQDSLALIPNELLTIATNTVEWPVALVGTFHERFLNIPHEVLITILEKQQRCFPLTNHAKELLSRFIIIANIASKEPEQVVAGNEKVVQARFTDAEYFYQNDRQQELATNLTKLHTISFQEHLGSLYDKVMRLKTVAAFLATQINIDVQATKRAAELAKCDLVTAMVWEFPELQGVIGYYYARAHETKEVALAIKEHYLPRFAQDQIPATKMGCVLALADRLDNLLGFFGINKIPSGDKDPFGLRRAATGILRIILEKNLTLDLKEMLEVAGAAYGHQMLPQTNKLVMQLLNFIYERLKFIYIEQHKNIQVFRAVAAYMPTNLQDFTHRFEALNAFIQLPEARDLLEIYKRLRNILDKANYQDNSEFKEELTLEPAERNLAMVVTAETTTIMRFYQNKQYAELFQALIKLKNPLSEFFDQVMVMVDNETIRRNRLALLNSIQNLFRLIADLSYLVSGNTER